MRDEESHLGDPDCCKEIEKAREAFRNSPHPDPNPEALEAMVRWSEENGLYDER